MVNQTEERNASDNSSSEKRDGPKQYKIMIFDRSNSWSGVLRRFLKMKFDCELLVTATHEEALALAYSESFDFIVLEGEDTSFSHFALIQALVKTGRGKLAPLVIYSPKIFPTQALENLDHPHVALVQSNVQELCITIWELVHWCELGSSR